VRALKAEVAAEVEAFLGAHAARGIDLEALEMGCRSVALRVAARKLEALLNADTRDHAGPAVKCSCGQMARYVGRRMKTFTSVLGTLELGRAYYHCATGRHGWYPRDRQMRLEGSSLTPGALRMVGIVATDESFQASSKKLHDIGGIDIDPKLVERAAEALGEEIARDERELREAPDLAEIAATKYMGVDGTGTPMRPDQVEGIEGKDEDGRARTRETKVVVTWTAESKDKHGLPTCDEGSQRYSAAIETVESKPKDKHVAPFVQRVIREGRRTGFDKAHRQVFVADGAVWIWALVAMLYPRAIQILDLYHALEHITKVAKSIFGAATDLATQWAKQQSQSIRDGKVDQVIADMRGFAANEDARLCADYFEGHKRRMRYPEFRAMGLCVGSGVVEAACRHVVGDRLKHSGMHWTVHGANAITALRCCQLSGRFEDFWERRAFAQNQRAA
jgi:hypothetical protein